MNARSPITTHVLDTARGIPAAGIRVKLTIWTESSREWTTLSEKQTDSDGRIGDLLTPGSELKHGVYQLIFYTEPYFTALKTKSFYPRIPVVFEVTEGRQHYHVPLLLNPFGYSTYRGS